MNTAAAFLVCGIAFLGLLFGAEGKYEAISANAIFHEPVLSVLDFPMGERDDDGCPARMRMDTISGECRPDRCPDPSSSDSSELSTGAIAGIAVGATVVVILPIALIVGIVISWRICCKHSTTKGKFTPEETEMKTVG